MGNDQDMSLEVLKALTFLISQYKGGPHEKTVSIGAKSGNFSLLFVVMYNVFLKLVLSI